MSLKLVTAKKGKSVRKILVIDRQPASRVFLKDILSGHYDVIEAANGAEAIELAGSHQIDLVLLDMDMPDHNGPMICALLKEESATKYLPLLLLSSCDQKEDIINGLHAGADDYITKPVSANELIARIDTHLSTKEHYEELEKEDLLMLIELADHISVTRNPKKIFTIIIEKITQITDVSRCSILSFSDDQELIVKASNDLPSDQEIKIDLEKYPEIKKALITQRPVILQDIGSSLLMEPVREKIQGIPFNSLFVVPIIKKQNVIGTFFLRTASPLRGGISKRILKLCQLVANISGNALENAVLFEAMQSNRQLLEDLVCRDSLTRLYNHQHFHSRFKEEFSRTQRYGQPLSCVFLDIDNFKRVNDNYGHIIGDVVLKQIGKLIEQVLRKSDIASRYGGEEFAVILPNTTSVGASEFAERLLKMIRGLAIPQINCDQITASIGVSTYLGGDMSSYKDLLCLADKAMYAAKLLEKDRVCQAT